MPNRPLIYTTIKDDQGNPCRIQPGDKVQLAPIDRKADKYSNPKKGFLTKETASSLRKTLGRRPYVVERIGQWPCGEVCLYISSKKHPEGFGANQENFRACP
ncbi:MAG: hypothetical protein QG609_111 [Patescibacteria group bacterium]|jgi:hypothetical protein|nr:hypothetical protein [Patescibacteria group bacterium]